MEEMSMKKTKINFWIDILIFIVFVGVIFTGVLLHRFPPEAKANTILSVSRYDWGDLHWVLCLSLILLTMVHLILHWGWIKGHMQKYIKIGPKALIGAGLLILIFFGIFAPVYLTRDFPNRKEFKDTYPKTMSRDIEETIDVADF
jgi:hypothetical protein